MYCPVCEGENTRCVETKMNGNDRYRGYKCNDCGARFRSREMLTAVKDEADGRYVPVNACVTDPRAMIDSLKKPFVEMRTTLAEMGAVLRTYDEVLRK